MLNKVAFTHKFKGAQNLRILCLSSLLILTPVAVSAQQIYNAPNGAVTSGNEEIRLQQMETQIRELTGRIEEQNHQIDQLSQKLQAVEESQTLSQSEPEMPQPLMHQSIGASQIATPQRDEPAVVINDPASIVMNAPETVGMNTATPTAVPTSPTASVIEVGDATAQYEEAYTQLKARNYDKAQQGFETFLSKYSDHVLAANAKYWLGETYYVRGEYKAAAKIFAEGFQTFPDSAKAPDMLLKLGMALAGMEKTSDACVALSQVAVKFPIADTDILDRAKSEMDRLSCSS